MDGRRLRQGTMPGWKCKEPRPPHSPQNQALHRSTAHPTPDANPHLPSVSRTQDAMPTTQQIVGYGAAAAGALLLARKLLAGSAELPPNPAVVITGCDMGIANETVKLLAKRGLPYKIYAGCLTEKGAADLAAASLLNVVTFPLDVTKDDSVAAMKSRFEAEFSESSGINLFAIWNIAGILRGVHVELSTIEDWHTVFEVNVFGVWRVTAALLPLLRRTAAKYPPGRYAKPRVITITSVVAELVVPAGSAYNASKHAASGLMATLRLEMKKFGIAVVQVQPWFAKSGLFSILNPAEADKIRKRNAPEALEAYGGEKMLQGLDYGNLMKSVPFITPEFVAQEMIDRALLPADPPYHVEVGVTGKVMLALKRYLPLSMSDSLMALG
ncbi:hypothetical protein DFJ74DRAFT_663204 [Hyaloraphidium curvatum]|nr:hypothetical protein DFJ74DRAFT_663204 [Hyaloraphidium curvatum]